MAKRGYKSFRRGSRARREADTGLGILVIVAGVWLISQYYRYQILVSSCCGFLVVVLLFLALTMRQKTAIRKADIATGLSLYDNFTPAQFEYAVSELFKLQGFQATVTPSSGDKGIDIFLRKDSRILGVQCKRYNPDASIGPDVVREFVGALEGARLTKGLIVATCLFSNGAYRAAENSRLEITLIDVERLGEWQNKLRSRLQNPYTAFIPYGAWMHLTKIQKGIILTLIALNTFVISAGGVYVLGVLAQ